MHSIFLFLSTISAFLAVSMGAFGAHALKTILSPEMLVVYKTAVTYQMWHALGLGLIALLRQQNPDSRLIIYAGWLMFSGIILFSGSLYILSLSGIKWLGMITPIGGICFLSAWMLLIIFSFKNYKKL
ncbi:conserved hypothetical protein [Bathymodiolus platifrons methanotrophic gill symbiont]|uniref:DUF423 domain-containing protein n=1 Tax=Bathymodiolus platifrons methanotrophic gill symbiont TaxID=113268 RepID=UPI000B40E509|nr:DUF423 domain-containing protein [Bathymodiolus platifrons methanotrophic gill symbiont]MCK5869402.1 DUF423 domain-containing protein [Methyloprofundus sp.]TXK97807.1 DUF423 domain-containing protein [Methylococcaceae bacterium CS4]TXL00398.1 DUF423 domain-containing protein [Methylococcaceae bacterium CS5]TXL02055.1 DUF423 domain-containing protein [Methylococcaceae bacterium HT1]TXL03476.1 DUF423 domain-containing protein [Methylococcaceae bacterium CS3]TXL08053.1 DUF423 domain-containin